LSDLHPFIVALVSLAANIACNHPKQGLCQIDRLKTYGVSKSQIDAVIEIARHIRDEAAQSLDAQFDPELASRFAPSACAQLASIAVAAPADGVCCTPTKSGQSCC
jgi:hypothetical protein